MRRTFLVLLVALMVAWYIGIAFAQEVQNPVQAISVSNVISTIKDKAVNAGVFYNWKAKSLQATYTYTICNWKDWDILSLGYGNQSILLASTGYVINVPKILAKFKITMPFATLQAISNNLSLVVNANVGLQDVGGKNKFTGGPGLTAKIKF